MSKHFLIVPIVAIAWACGSDDGGGGSGGGGTGGTGGGGTGATGGTDSGTSGGGTGGGGVGGTSGGGTGGIVTPGAWVRDPSPVDLPQSYVDLSYQLPVGCTEVDVGAAPPSGCAIWTVDSGQDLQTALNDARLGDIVQLEAGATFTGNFAPPNKTSGSGWIYVVSSNLASLPAFMNRVNPNDRIGTCDESAGLPCGVSANTDVAADMPTIQGAGTQPHYALAFAANAHHYRFIGIRIKPAAGVFASALIRTYPEPTSGGDPGTHDIIFDRCYVPADPSVGGGRGIVVTSRNSAVINSYIPGWWGTDLDTQAILVFDYAHVVALVNNYAEASGENFYSDMGGDAASNPSDLEVRWNYLRKPLDWRAHVGAGWNNVKNLWETKSGHRILIEGNVFADSWGDAAQETAVNIKIGDEDPDKFTAHHTVRKNVWNRVGNAIKMCGTGCNGPGLAGKSLAAYNNLMYAVDGALYGRDNAQDGMCFYQMVSADGPYIVANNTCYSGGQMFGLTVYGGNGNATGGSIINNIGQVGGYPFTAAEFNSMFSGGSSSYTGNVIVGGTCSDFPSGNLCPANWAAVQFENVVANDFRLASGSAYKGACTDTYNIGTTDCGANIPVVTNAVSCALTGQCAAWAPPAP